MKIPNTKIIIRSYCNKINNFIWKKTKRFIVIVVVFVIIVTYVLKILNVEDKYIDEEEMCDERCYALDNVFPKVNYSAQQKFNINSDNYCPSIPQNLVGQFSLNLSLFPDEVIEESLSSLGIKFGGKWQPNNCTARHHIAILIPYRNRKMQLKSFLLNMHPLLVKQQVSYGIYLIEPIQNIKFNRGLLLNIGFIESNKESNNLWECYALHDVDLLPEDDRMLYICPDNPSQFSYRISTFFYQLPYEGYFGGVSVVNKRHYIQMNGFSNSYFNWGGEDDDFYNRAVAENLTIDWPRYPLGRYFMHFHEQEEKNQERVALLESSKQRYKREGLNSIKYKLIGTKKTALYTKFLVLYDERKIMKDANIPSKAKNN